MNNSPIYFNDSLTLATQLNQNNYSKIFILVDENTHKYCLPNFLSKIENDIVFEIIEVPPGEESKEINTTLNCWLTLSELDADRKSLLINLGGGVITDLGGFVASTYKRGIPFINIPTSLLAMVDASVGGKNGINLNSIKNQVGTFNLPIATYIFHEFLDTLPPRHLTAGFAEMLKHGLIADAKHWNNLTQLSLINETTIAPFIADSVAIKQVIVNQDPLEKGLRKSLNFGHTIGHAIESEFLHHSNPLLHGEAIAYGMIIESIMAVNLQLMHKKILDEIYYYITNHFELKVIPTNTFNNLINWLKNDKKNENGEFSFSLISDIGESKIEVHITEKEIIESINQFNKKIKS